MTRNSYALFHAATRAVREQSDTPAPHDARGYCSCCGRDLAEVEEPGKAYAFTDSQSPGAIAEPRCTTCHTLKLDAREVLGVERLARGRPDAPVPVRLGMLKGTGAVIGADAVLRFAMPPKNMTKYAKGAYGRAGQLYPMRGRVLLKHCLDEGLINPAEGFVYISDFGRQPAGLMRTLRLTTDLAEIWANSARGPTPFDLAAHLDVLDWARTHDRERDVCRAIFWRPIQDAARGRYNPKAVRQWVDKIENAHDLLERLPPDPAQRLDIHATLSGLLRG